MVKIKDDQLAGIIENEISKAQGSMGDEVSANREAALRYYLGQPRGDERPGRSAIISMDVADMVNAVTAQLVPMISTDAVVEFEPNGSEDEDQVRAESDAVNMVVLEDNQGLVELQEAVRDALLLRNGWMKVWVEEDQRTRKLRFDQPLSAMNAEEVGIMLEPQAPNEKREQTGDDQITITITNRTFKVAAVAPENMLYEANATTMRLDDLRFVAERILLTRSELRERGISRKVVDALPAYEVDVKIDSTARNRTYDPNNSAETRDQDLIECYEAYLLIDMDGDGISERWRFLVAGEARQVLEKEEAPCVPYACGTAIIYPHRLMGESLFDHLKPVQDAKTGALRQWLDNLVAANNSRLVVVENSVNMSDVLQSRPGGAIRANSLDTVMPLPFNDVGGPAQSLLGYMDQIRRERGGAALDMMSADAQIVSNQTASGLERQYSSREQMVALYAKNLSETMIRNLYLLVHKYLRLYANEPLMVRQSGQWVPVDPRSWPERKRLNVTTGLTPGQRSHVQMALQQLMQMQQMVLQTGAPLADMSSAFKAAIDWMRYAGVDNPEQYLVDPSSPQGQQMAQQQAEQAQAQQQKMEQMQQAMLAMQADLENKKLELDRWKHETELRWKFYDTDADNERTEAKIVADATLELQKEAVKANGKSDRPNGPGKGAANN